MKPEAKNQNKGYLRKIFLRIIVVSIIVTLVWCGWVYTRPEKFPIKNVKIFASYEHLDQTTLQNIISSYLKQGFFYLNVIRMKKQLLKLPWVYTVSIERKWPDTVIISVVEQKAILQWGKNGLINAEGIIFSPQPKTFPPGLPLIFGPEKRTTEIFSLYKKMGPLFEPLDLTINKLVLNLEHYWELLLSNDLAVYLKEEDPLNQIELLVRLYKKIVANRKQAPKSIDLRYKTGLAVRW